MKDKELEKRLTNTLGLLTDTSDFDWRWVLSFSDKNGDIYTFRRVDGKEKAEIKIQDGIIKLEIY